MASRRLMGGFPPERDKIILQVREYVFQVSRQDIELREDTQIRDLGLDSLDIYTIITDLECRYDFDLVLEDNEELRTIGDLVDYIQRDHKQD